MVIPDAICDAESMNRPLRIVPYGLKNFIPQEGSIAQELVDDDIDIGMNNIRQESPATPAPQPPGPSLSPSGSPSDIPFEADYLDDGVSFSSFNSSPELSSSYVSGE